MKKYLKQEIEKQRNHYKQSYVRMLSDFKGERELTDNYNGRQLLELIQNADDANSDVIEIDLDETNKTLTISNTGTPFSKEGFQSLMIPNLSGKTENCYIGNKGLGFRAVINWADKIVINSGNVEVEFSRAIAERAFNDLFDDDEKKRIREDKRSPENSIPVAFLAIPTVRNVNSKEGWTTRICIHYKPGFVENIKSQMEELENEILLFLNHIDEIKFKTADRSRSISRQVKDNDIKIDGDEWHLYELEGDLPEELQDEDKHENKFSLKLALTDNLDKSSDKLFAYFPTKVAINFPMVIHGTFDLDISRNQLTETEKNKYILERLIELIIKTATGISDNEVSWKPLNLLNYESKNTILEKLKFYESIDAAILEQPLFPCIDNKYRTYNEVNYFENDLTNLIVDTNNIDIFNNLVKPTSQIEDYRRKYNLSDRIDNLKNKINELSERIIGNDIKYRVDLIYLITKLNAGCKFDLLINKDKEIIGESNDIYTPITTNSVDDFILPDFVKIEFIDRGLFEYLLKKFEIDTSDKARDLQRKIKSITNIQSYEPAQVLQKIIATTNNKVKEEPNRATEYISKMVVALYKSYSRIPSKTKISSNIPVKLLAKDNSINDAKDLYLSGAYPSGEITELLFGSVFEQKQFLADPQVYDQLFSSENKDDIERYFLWLGVNKHTKFCKKTHDLDDYERYVLECVVKPDGYRDCELDVTAIDDESFRAIVKQLSKEELVFWVISDPDIRKNIDNMENNDVFKYRKKGERESWQGTFRHRLSKKPSYINCQLNKGEMFNDYLILDDKSIDFINPFDFDYEHPLFVEHKIQKRDIDSMLLSLGAEEKFEELSFNRVEWIIKNMESFNKPTHTHKIYKLALEHHKKHKQKLGTNIRLFAKKGDDKGYFNNSEIYFTENIQLPKKVAKDIALLDFPRRAGGRQAIKFFNIKNLDEIKIQVENHEIIHDLTDEFNELFDSLKPYILTYRIENLTKDQQVAANRLNELSIGLCSKIECSVVDGGIFSLEVNDYVVFEKEYLINIKNCTLSKLRKDSLFCDTFSEILSSHFRVEDHQDDFRKVFRETDAKELKHIIEKNLGVELLNESKKLLGISDTFSSFWNAIYKSIKCQNLHKLTTKNIDAIKDNLNIIDMDVSNINYGSLGESSNLITIRSIFESLKINISDFNKHAYYKLDLSETHETKLKNIFHANLIKYKSILWNMLSDKTVMEQKKFLDYMAKYEKNEEWIKDKIEPHKYQFEVDYNGLWKNFITDSHGELSFDEEYKFDGFHESNEKQFDKIKLLSLSTSHRSLLYFENGADHVRKEETHNNIAPTGSQELESLTQDIPDGSIDTIAPHPDSNSKKRGGSYKHNINGEQAKKERGQKSENIVFNSLVQEFSCEFVDHASESDDSLGYDIKYSSDSGETWRYVEVKSIVANQVIQFILSNNEFEFYKRYKSDYEIFLVDKNDKILKPLRNIELEDEKKFDMEPRDYTVRFETKG